MYLLLITLSLTVGNTYSQVIEVSNTVDKTHLVEVEDGLYKALIKNSDGKLRQVGFYKEHISGKLIKDGLWKMYDDQGSLLVSAIFKENQLVWIKPKGEKKYTSEEIRLHQSKRKIESLVNN
jgi:antitoxin component YwqK of YwqJK toxin-antitoxin module